MFKKFTSLLEPFVFWFVFACALALAITLLSVFIFAWVPPSFVLVPAFGGLLWCLFAGIVPVLVTGYKRLSQSFNEEL